MEKAKGRYVKVADRLLSDEMVHTPEGRIAFTVAHDGDRYYVHRTYECYSWLSRRDYMSYEELISALPKELHYRLKGVNELSKESTQQSKVRRAERRVRQTLAAADKRRFSVMGWVQQEKIDKKRAQRKAFAALTPGQKHRHRDAGVKHKDPLDSTSST